MQGPTALNGLHHPVRSGPIAFSIIGRWTVAMTSQHTRVMKQRTEHDRISSYPSDLRRYSGANLCGLQLARAADEPRPVPARPHLSQHHISHYAFLSASCQGLWGLSGRGPFRRRSMTNPIAIDDIATLKRMVALRDEAIAQLLAEIARLKRWQYGRSSERMAELMGQLRLALGDLPIPEQETEVPPANR